MANPRRLHRLSGRSLRRHARLHGPFGETWNTALQVSVSRRRHHLRVSGERHTSAYTYLVERIGKETQFASQLEREEWKERFSCRGFILAFKRIICKKKSNLLHFGFLGTLPNSGIGLGWDARTCGMALPNMLCRHDENCWIRISSFRDHQRKKKSLFRALYPLPPPHLLALIDQWWEPYTPTATGIYFGKERAGYPRFQWWIWKWISDGRNPALCWTRWLRLFWNTFFELISTLWVLGTERTVPKCGGQRCRQVARHHRRRKMAHEDRPVTRRFERAPMDGHGYQRSTGTFTSRTISWRIAVATYLPAYRIGDGFRAFFFRCILKSCRQNGTHKRVSAITNATGSCKLDGLWL